MNRLVYILFGLLFTLSVMADNTLGLPPLKIPSDNPLTEEKIALGLKLFQDKRFSGDATISSLLAIKLQKRSLMVLQSLQA